MSDFKNLGAHTEEGLKQWRAAKSSLHAYLGGYLGPDLGERDQIILGAYMEGSKSAKEEISSVLDKLDPRYRKNFKKNLDAIRVQSSAYISDSEGRQSTN